MRSLVYCWLTPLCEIIMHWNSWLSFAWSYCSTLFLYVLLLCDSHFNLFPLKLQQILSAFLIMTYNVLLDCLKHAETFRWNITTKRQDTWAWEFSAEGCNMEILREVKGSRACRYLKNNRKLVIVVWPAVLARLPLWSAAGAAAATHSSYRQLRYRITTICIKQKSRFQIRTRSHDTHSVWIQCGLPCMKILLHVMFVINKCIYKCIPKYNSLTNSIATLFLSMIAPQIKRWKSIKI